MITETQIKLKKCKYEFDYEFGLFDTRKVKHYAFVAMVNGENVGKIGLIIKDRCWQEITEDLDAPIETIRQIIKESLKRIFKD